MISYLKLLTRRTESFMTDEAVEATQRGGSLIKNKLLSEIKQLKFELLLVSKLAADKPMFFSPLNAHAAKAIRDKVLENQDEYVIK